MDNRSFMEKICWFAGISLLVLALLPGCSQESVEDPTDEAASLAPGSYPPVTIEFNDALYEVVFEGVENRTWCYTVTRQGDAASSFWMFTVENFGTPDWLDHIIDASPPGFVIGTEPNTGYTGIRWPFDSGLFCFTLDVDYPESEIIATPIEGSNSTTGLLVGPGSPEGDEVLHDQGTIE